MQDATRGLPQAHSQLTTTWHFGKACLWAGGAGGRAGRPEAGRTRGALSGEVKGGAWDHRLGFQVGSLLPDRGPETAQRVVPASAHLAGGKRFI